MEKNERQKQARKGMDEIEEEVIFRGIDGLMMHYYLKSATKPAKDYGICDEKNLYIDTNYVVRMPKSKHIFTLKNGDHYYFMKEDDPPPYSEQARRYTPKMFSDILWGMTELEPGLQNALDAYKECIKIEKSGKGTVPKYLQQAIKEAHKILLPYRDELAKYDEGRVRANKDMGKKTVKNS